jgi:hypothetical protein
MGRVCRCLERRFFTIGRRRCRWCDLLLQVASWLGRHGGRRSLLCDSRDWDGTPQKGPLPCGLFVETMARRRCSISSQSVVGGRRVAVQAGCETQRHVPVGFRFAAERAICAGSTSFLAAIRWCRLVSGGSVVSVLDRVEGAACLRRSATRAAALRGRWRGAWIRSRSRTCPPSCHQQRRKSPRSSRPT